MGRLNGKVAVVTGGALGIGHSTALRMGQEGAMVAVLDIQDGGDTVRAITGGNGTAKYWSLDTTDESRVKQVFAEVVKEFGKLDVLVNNAGIAGADKPTHELSEAEWDRVMAVNVKGVFFCVKHAVPYMRQAGGGSIINLSSIYGLVGAPDLPPYHASKGAVRLMTKTDALLYAQDRIRVNSVHPGFIMTPLVEGLADQAADGAQAFRTHLDSLHPIGHVGEPDDIAYGIVYLASDEAKFVTGSELVIDGGYTTR